MVTRPRALAWRAFSFADRRIGGCGAAGPDAAACSASCVGTPCCAAGDSRVSPTLTRAASSPWSISARTYRLRALPRVIPVPEPVAPGRAGAIRVIHEAIDVARNNVGDGPGTVVAIAGKFGFLNVERILPAIPEYPAPITRNDILKSGDWIQCQHFADDMTRQDFSFSVGFMEAMAADPDSENPSLLFLGYVDYVDEGGRKRQRAFLRQFDFKTGRFGPIEHPDYEYQD
jgi:hypothetical protein